MSLTFLAFFIDAGRLFQVQAPKKVKLFVWLWAICILLSAADLVLWLWTLLLQTNRVSKHWLVLSFKHLYTWTAKQMLGLLWLAKTRWLKFSDILIFNSCNRQIMHSLARVVKALWGSIVTLHGEDDPAGLCDIRPIGINLAVFTLARLILDVIDITTPRPSHGMFVGLERMPVSDRIACH